MLFTNETESQILSILGALATGASAFIIGRELGQGVISATTSALSTRSLTFLEQAFLAGKLAQRIGPNRIKRMSEAQLTRWIQRNNITLNKAELAHLDLLRRETQDLLRSSDSTWASKFRQEIAKANKSWRAELAASSFDDASARTLARNSALEKTLFTLRETSDKFKSDFGRIVQTEMHHYFQEGQVGGLSGDKIVYKIPRASACPYCMRLHLNPDGSPIKYRLSDVQGNSNWGAPASSWVFTIGPVHPYCYCILYIEGDQRDPGPSKKLATARKDTLKKALNLEFENECGVKSPAQTFEDFLQQNTKETPPEFVEPLLKVVRDLDLPVC